MPTARHRGPDPLDRDQLGPEALPALRDAVFDLSWLRGRGYSEKAARKLVGDRRQLTGRQRLAIARSACSDAQRLDRGARRVADVAGRRVQVDGFNALITLERALSGGPVLVGRDGAHRDLAGVHGSWRPVAETDRALALAAEILAEAEAVTWLLDAPVSNSGRLARRLRALAPWEVEVIPRPDPRLAAFEGVVATSDAGILDRCGPWFDLPGAGIARSIPDAWRVDLRG